LKARLEKSSKLRQTAKDIAQITQTLKVV